MDTPDVISTRPYLIRALYEWCTENGFTPYVAVAVDDSVQVPREYVKDGEIVLNVSFDATSSLKLGNDFIEFKARFAGTAREIMVPVGRVIAVYARENGQGMSFPLVPVQGSKTFAGAGSALGPVPARQAAAPDDARHGTPHKDKSLEHAPESGTSDDPPPKPGSGSRPTLTRVK